ncbi:ABC transporter ATP-binding protein [Oceanobacillus salinisoli]|uniref:ABC transporter ATP-binding protein n=1 Tax=Oceanobacillus salinisoli TaxID=2678611 RepID=UPI0018CC18C7|nr:ABC transporter ATP-binding protein [Oceanobacillus salinisoli]
MGISLLDVIGLEKKFQNFQLGPMDLKVEQGMVVGLVGANGSGKSTLFKLLMNILRKDNGQILLFGKNVEKNEIEVKQKVGFAGDLLDPYGHLTIEELAGMIAYWYPTWNKEQFNHLIKKYNINTEEKFGKCSKGTKKKVEFIFSLSHDSALLLLDEPTAGVDIVSQRKMKEDLILFMEEGERSIIIATHNADEINQLCDDIVVLQAGKIIYSFNKDEVYENWAKLWVSRVPDELANHPNVILFSTNTPVQVVTNNAHKIERVLQSKQVSISHSQRLTMEEVFEYLIET